MEVSAESISFWKSVDNFAFLNDHLMFEQVHTVKSKVVVERNDGRTFHFYYANRSWIASNIGSTEWIINYDVRPHVGGYKFIDGRYIPHPKGDVIIEGYYPNYRIAGLFIPVFIGPNLHFYTTPQKDIFELANSGRLRPPDVHVTRGCLKCGSEIPKSLGPRAQYCSVACGLVTREMLQIKKFARQAERRFNIPNVKPVRRCQKCNGPIPKNFGARARFCSVECGLVTREMLDKRRDENIAKRQMSCEELKPVRRCQKCNGPIPKNFGGRSRFCSVECGLVTRSMLDEGKKHPCEHCGKPFTRHGAQRFCSKKCKLENELGQLK